MGTGPGPMRPAKSVDELVGAPVGRYLVGRCWLVWCQTSELVGTVLWGRPLAEDVANIEQAWAFRKPLPGPIDMITDLSRIEGFDRGTFQRVLAYAIHRRADLEGRVGRHVVVRPAGYDGAVVAGFSALISVSKSWRLVESSRHAFEWLRPKETSVRDDVEALVAAATGELLLVDRARTMVERDLELTLEQLAKALSLSTRSLQRALGQQGTSFRELLAERRVAAAAELLEQSDEKLMTIARSVGLRSDGQLIRLFQERLGETPNEYRRRRRDEKAR